MLWAALLALAEGPDLSPAGVTLRARALDHLRSVKIPGSESREFLRFDVDGMGRVGAVIDGDRLRVFSLRSDAEILTSARSGLLRVAVDPSGRRVYAADGQGMVYAFEPGQEPRPVIRIEEGGHRIDLLRVAPSGRRALAVTQDGFIVVFQLPGGRRQAVAPAGAGCDAVFSRSEGEVHFVTTGRRAGTLRIDGNRVENGALPETGVPGGLILAAASPRGDRCALLPQGATTEIRLCDPTSGLLVATLRPEQPPASLRFDPSGDWLVARVASELWFWDARSGDRARILRLASPAEGTARPGIGEPAFAARTGWVATAAVGHVQVWGPGGRPSADRRRGFLGVEWQSGTLAILRVLADSPAERAGLRVGDTFVEINGERGFNATRASQLIADAGAGSELRIVVSRNGTEVPLSVRLAPWPPEQ